MFWTSSRWQRTAICRAAAIGAEARSENHEVGGQPGELRRPGERGRHAGGGERRSVVQPVAHEEDTGAGALASADPRELFRGRHAARRLVEPERLREPLDTLARVTGKKRDAPEAPGVKIRDDLPCSGPELLFESEERPPFPPIPENGDEPPPSALRSQRLEKLRRSFPVARHEVGRPDPPADTLNAARHALPRVMRHGTRSSSRAAASSSRARAIGCGEPSSNAEAIARASSAVRPADVWTFARRGVASVNVPVLSKPPVSALASLSIAATRAGRTPILAKRPAAIVSTTGVARARAQGQVTIKTATVAESASEASRASQNAAVAAERRRTATTSQPARESASCANRGRLSSAFSRRRRISPSVESSPARVTRIRTGRTAVAASRHDSFAGLSRPRPWLARQDRLVEARRAVEKDSVGRDDLVRSRRG